MNFNTARFFLSRLESLSAAPTSLSFLRFRSKSSKSSEGGQGETVSSTSFQPQTRLTLASALWPQWFLVDVCARAGKTLISRSNLSASGSCRALRACPLWHLPSVCASASRTRKPPSNTIGQRELTDVSASVLTSPSCPARMKQWCIISMVVNQQL